MVNTEAGKTRYTISTKILIHGVAFNRPWWANDENNRDISSIQREDLL
jgi:hypothetical protein